MDDIALADAPGRSGPRRRCLAGGGVQEKSELIRFVVGPDGGVVPDVDERLPGRGFWLSADRDVLKKACAKNLFARAARAPVRVPADLGDRVEGLLVQRCQSLIGLARRAGQAVFGFEKVRGWIAEGRAAVLVEASDGARGSRHKLRAPAGSIRRVTVLRSDELGAAVGRERAVHGALTAGSLADRLCREAARLGGFRKAAAAAAGAETHHQEDDEASSHERR